MAMDAFKNTCHGYIGQHIDFIHGFDSICDDIRHSICSRGWVHPSAGVVGDHVIHIIINSLISVSKFLFGIPIDGFLLKLNNSLNNSS